MSTGKAIGRRLYIGVLILMCIINISSTGQQPPVIKQTNDKHEAPKSRSEQTNNQGSLSDTPNVPKGSEQTVQPVETSTPSKTEVLDSTVGKKEITKDETKLQDDASTKRDTADKVLEIQKAVASTFEIVSETQQSLEMLPTLPKVDRVSSETSSTLDAFMKVLPEVVRFTKQEGSTAKTNLIKAKAVLKTKCDALGFKVDTEGSNSKLKDTRDQCDKMQSQINRQIDFISSYATLFQENLSSLAVLFTSLTAETKGLPDIGADEKTEDLLKESRLARLLFEFADALSTEQHLMKTWAPIAPNLDTACTDNSALCTSQKDANKAAESYQTTLAKSDIPCRLSKWFETLHQTADEDTNKSTALITDSLLHPTQYYEATTLREAKDAADHAAGVKQVLSGWAFLSKRTDLRKFDCLTQKESNIKRSVDQLVKSHQALSTYATRIQDLLARKSEFVTEQQSLYYFTDLPRLIQFLNPLACEQDGASSSVRDSLRSASAGCTPGDIKNFQDKAREAGKALAEAELNVAEKEAAISNLQGRVLRLKEEQRAAKARLVFIENMNTTSERRLDALRKQQAKSIGDKQKAEDNLVRENQRHDEFENDRKQALQDVNQKDQEGKDLPARIVDAQSSLEAAQNSLSLLRRQSILAAEDEADAFARSRDNRPYWKADGDPLSPDPVKRVDMFAFTEGKTIFMRGKLEDVQRARQIIAAFDHPAPQARLTLWTMELTSNTDPRSRRHNENDDVKRVNHALQRIEAELANSRAEVSASLSFLRDEINQVANQAFDKLRDDQRKAAVREQCFLVRDRQFEPCIRKHAFYSQAAMLQLGPINTYYREPVALLPDPSGTTTLGEALMVLSLAKRAYRRQIFDQFEKDLADKLTALNLRNADSVKSCDDYDDMRSANKRFDFKTVCLKKFRHDVKFTLLRRALDLDGDYFQRARFVANADPLQKDTEFSEQTDEEQRELTAPQREIVAAVATVAQSRLADELEELGTKLAANQQLLDYLRSRGDQQTPGFANTSQQSTKPTQQSPITKAQRDETEITERFLRAELVRLINGHDKDHALTELYQCAKAQEITECLGAGGGLQTVEIAGRLRRGPLLKQANARVAAADQMLKELIIAVEDDLDRLFIAPMLNRLREDLVRSHGLRVGILQRTSMLATNRLLARVDAKGSAQLAIGEEQDLLGEVRQLAQIYTAVQMGGPLGTFNALKASPKEPQPEIYGLTTGNKFEVTPIFDPSGQALRFKFDFVAANNILEPNGTVNVKLPRVERHTVNTEVQISNLEMREISRFEANSQVGRPTLYSGGIPILRDIPYLNRVPLFGWFVRQAGKSAATQESLIFGQTTMYPTIEDIIELLGASDSQPRANDPSRTAENR